MLRIPKREPKGYDLSDVTPCLMSAAEHTPEAFPRVTQTTLGKYCRPIETVEDDTNVGWKIVPINAQVLDKMTQDNKAWWIDKPGADAYFLHDMYKKYNVNVDIEHDPRYQYKPRIFQRSFKYELDSLEENRQQLISDKIRRDECVDEQINVEANNGPRGEKSPEEVARKEECKQILDAADVDTTEYRSSYLRWQETPRLFAPSLKEPCARRRAFQLFRQPFKHEACSWYYVNYPAPDIPFRPEKF